MVGFFVGLFVGFFVGLAVGFFVGLAVGFFVGLAVGLDPQVQRSGTFLKQIIMMSERLSTCAGAVVAKERSHTLTVHTFSLRPFL